MIALEERGSQLIGALVRYDGGFDPEWGLVRSLHEDGERAYVSFHLGDTAAGCYLRDLTLIVPAVRPQDAERLVEYARLKVWAAEVAAALGKDTTTDYGWALAKLEEITAGAW